MAASRASMMKIDFVLEVARKDPRFLGDLSRDPFRTLSESGIDLSPGETQAIIDIVRDQSVSTLAPLLSALRKRWSELLTEQKELSRKPTKKATTKKKKPE